MWACYYHILKENNYFRFVFKKDFRSVYTKHRQLLNNAEWKFGVRYKKLNCHSECFSPSLRSLGSL